MVVVGGWVDRLNGGVLLRNVALSLDPFQRNLMGNASDYSGAFEIGARCSSRSTLLIKLSRQPCIFFSSGKPLGGIVIGEVLRSEVSEYPVGSFLMGMGKFEEYSVFSGPEELTARFFRALPKDSGLPWTTWLGAAGAPGQVRSAD